MTEIYDRIRQVALVRATTSSSTGKAGRGMELVAQSLHHAQSAEGRATFVCRCIARRFRRSCWKANSSAMRKAPSPAPRNAGRAAFEEANHGTIFLDEIGEIDAATQVKLLARRWANRRSSGVGSSQTLKVDVRVVAATNKDLEALVREGKFREDLFYRLDVVPIHLPPLRERREDIPLLANAFLQEFAKQNRKKVTGFSSEAQEALQRYDWPGNVRELRAAIEHAVALCRGERIALRDFPGRIAGQAGQARISPSGEIKVGADLNLEKMEQNFIRQALHLTPRKYHGSCQTAGHQSSHASPQTQFLSHRIYMNITQAILHSIEEGKARILTRLIPFVVVLLVIILVYDVNVFIGLDDPQSMDNAQLARQLSGERVTRQNFCGRPHWRR